jgi:uncharacterized protein YjbI with pentapeptide repeats
VRKWPAATFSHASLRRADLFSSDLRLCKFDGANLSGARLHSADCRGASFVDADLTGVGLEKTRLEGANLKGALLDKDRPLLAAYDDDTIWPVGFDLATAQCVKVDQASESEREQDLS